MAKLTIDSVQRDFEHWRASRDKIGKIPDALWSKVLQLLDNYPVGEVSGRLRLSGNQIANKRKKCTSVSNNLSLPPIRTDNFMEINIPSPNIEGSIAISTKRIEIKRPDGAILSMDMVSDQIMLQVLNQFTMAVQQCYN